MEKKRKRNVLGIKKAFRFANERKRRNIIELSTRLWKEGYYNTHNLFKY